MSCGLRAQARARRAWCASKSHASLWRSASVGSLGQTLEEALCAMPVRTAAQVRAGGSESSTDAKTRKQVLHAWEVLAEGDEIIRCYLIPSFRPLEVPPLPTRAIASGFRSVAIRPPIGGGLGRLERR